jgi:Holliday junction resolvase RusA-like endonuclease
MSHKFIFRVKPTSKERPRFGLGGRVFTPKKTKDAESEIVYLAKSQWRKEPIKGLIAAHVEFHFKHPNKTKLDTPKKDIDNLQKLIFDALNEILYIDDTQIVEVIATKQWSSEDKILLTIVEL